MRLFGEQDKNSSSPVQTCIQDTHWTKRRVRNSKCMELLVRGVVPRGQEAVAAPNVVDAEIVAYRAGAIRAGGTAAGPLPRDLSIRRQRQQRAQEELADAAPTLAVLLNPSAAAILSDRRASCRTVRDRRARDDG